VDMIDKELKAIVPENIKAASGAAYGLFCWV